MHVNEASFSCRRCGAKWNMTDAKKELEQVPDSLRIREPDSKELPLHFLPYVYSAFIHCLSVVPPTQLYLTEQKTFG